MALNPLSARMFPAWVESTHLESAIGYRRRDARLAKEALESGLFSIGIIDSIGIMISGISPGKGVIEVIDLEIKGPYITLTKQVGRNQ